MSIAAFDPVSLGLGILDTVVDAVNLGSSAHYQRRNMRESARLQHEENVYWAEYNTPANQMKRLAEAGLNPNLVYGNGANVTAGGSVSPGGGSMPSVQKSRFGVDYLTMRNMAAQNENLQAQTEAQKQEAELKKQEARSQFLDNIRKENAIPARQGAYDLKSREYELNNLLTDNEKKQSEIYYNHVRSELEQVHVFTERQLREIEVNIQQAILDNLPQKLQAELKLTEAQARKCMQDIVTAAALADQYRAMTSYYTSLRQKLELEGENIAADTNLKQVEFDLKKLETKYKEYMNDVQKWSVTPDIIDRYVRPVKSVLGAGSNAAGIVSSFVP